MAFNYMYILASVLFNKSILRKEKRKRRRRRGGHKRTCYYRCGGRQTSESKSQIASAEREEPRQVHPRPEPLRQREESSGGKPGSRKEPRSDTRCRCWPRRRQETREGGSSSPSLSHGTVSGRKNAADRPGRGAEKLEWRAAPLRETLRRTSGEPRGAGQGETRGRRRERRRCSGGRCCGC